MRNDSIVSHYFELSNTIICVVLGEHHRVIDIRILAAIDVDKDSILEGLQANYR